MPTWAARIEAHYRDAWPVEPERCVFSAGPIGDLPADFAVLRFRPHGARTLWTYATRCMSQPADVQPIELHMFSHRQADELVELLVATAHFHTTAHALDVGHSVDFGRPWIDRSACGHGLVSLPYLDGPALQVMTRDATPVEFLWLIPVTASEVAYKKDHGVDALEAAFERTGFDYADTRRNAVV